MKTKENSVFHVLNVKICENVSSHGHLAPRHPVKKMTLDIMNSLKDVEAAKKAIPDIYFKTFAVKTYPIIF